MRVEEIDIKEIIYYIFKKKVWVILCCILGLIAGVVYTKFFVTPMYSSYSTVVLSKPTDTSVISSTTTGEGISQNDITLNSKLVATYSEIMKSRAVASEVKEKLGLDISEEALMSNISVTAKDDTEMLKIQVSNEDPVVAANVANSLSEVFSSKVKEIYNIENVTVIDTAIASSSPYNVSYAKNAAIFGMVGLVLSCGVLFIIFYFDTTIKSKSEVEDLLGLEVLAVIPDIK